jgi:hypothetical protein
VAFPEETIRAVLHPPGVGVEHGAYILRQAVVTAELRSAWTGEAPVPTLARPHTSRQPCDGCNTRKVLPPCDQTSTSASCPFGTPDSA